MITKEAFLRNMKQLNLFEKFKTDTEILMNITRHLKSSLWTMTQRLLSFCFLSLCISGCSSLEETPIGIGSDMDALKKSACPCGKVFYSKGIRV